MKRNNSKILIPVIAIAAGSILSSCLVAKDDEATSRSSAIGTDGQGIVVPGAPNVAVPASFTTYATILNQFSSVTGTTPSSSTLTIYDLNKTSFPLQGKASEISAGMWMSISALAGSVCADLYGKELGLAGASRIYYGDLALGATNNFNTVVAGAAIKNRIYRRYALGFWGRAVTSAEEAEFDAALSAGGFNLSTMTGEETRQALLILCSGALASLSAISI